jgi:hypothetical protein
MLVLKNQDNVNQKGSLFKEGVHMQEKSYFRIRTIIPLVLLLSLLLPVSVTHAQGWYNSNWQFRKAITIESDLVDADLANFPVLIDITDTQLADAALVNGDDILFTDATGTFQLDHEIEYYDKTSEMLVAWVEVPLLDADADTTLYMYYGNTGAASQEDVAGTWDGSNYVMVHHLEETTGTHNDSTANGNNSDAAPADQDAPGSIDGADDFDGSTDYVRVPDNISLQFGDGSFTAEAWIYPHAIPDSGGARIVNTRGTGAGGSYPGWQFKIKRSGSNWIFSDASVDDATGNYRAYNGTATHAYNAWYHVVMVYEADTELRFYVNGALDGTPLSVPATYGSISNSLPTVIGASLAENGSEAGPDKQFFDGIIDEVRLSNTVRSTDWITASYRNQNDPAFYVLGAQAECVVDADCDDGVGCTIDTCNAGTGTCVFTPDDIACDDGEFCTGVETCDPVNDCQPGPGDPCVPDVCDEINDVCVNCLVDADCDDGVGCTDDICDAGTSSCVFPPNDAVCDDGVVCTVETCDPVNDCQFTPDDAACDDSLFCTGVETCDPVNDCQPGPGDPCVPDLCDEINDVCVECLVDGDCADDGIVCTDETCDAGFCISTPDDAACDDSLFCTGVETCDPVNDCQNGTAPDCNDSVACTDDSCNEGTDSCDNLPNDGFCDNALWCDGAETCDPVNDCQNGTAPVCNDSVACTDDSCNEGTDSCDYVPNNAHCDNSLWCDGIETCDPVNDCQPGPGDPCLPKMCDEGTDTCVNCLVDGDCDDSDVCTDDYCIFGFCSWSYNIASCDDGDACTTGEACFAGNCEGGTPLDCDDSDACTDDSCDTVLGCVNTDNTASCDDSDACTDDSCDTVLGCVNTDNTASCDDSNTCTDDSCDTVLGCVNTDNTAPCDDAVFCNGNDTCSGGACSEHDGNPCVPPEDVCNEASDTCELPPECVVNGDCDDGVVCTVDTCAAGICVFTPDHTSCDDGEFCTGQETCDPVNDCQAGPGDPCVPDTCDEVNDVCFTTGPDWWDTLWLYRKKITIDPANVDADLTDFPVLIDLTDADLADHAQENGDDLVFTDDNAIQLDHEIEYYDNVPGKLIAWVRVSDLSSTEETVLYLYFGNSDAGNQENVPGTWDSGYIMVQHLDETDGTHFDSTINANDGTPYDLANQGAGGKIDGADAFDDPSTPAEIDVGTDPSMDVFGLGQDFSIFLWVKRDAINEVEGFFSSGSSGPNGIFFGSASSNEDDLKFMSKNNTVQIDSTTDVIGDTEWHLVGVTADRDGALEFWVDGELKHSESIAAHAAEDWNRADDTYKIGTDRSEMSPMDGIIDEVRLSDEVRSDGWILTSYTNQHAPGTFYTVGGLQIVVDGDMDGVPDSVDNCPTYPNGPLQGTCTLDDGVNLIVSTGQFCTVDADCDPGEFCEKTQLDTYPPGGNGIGDACDCEADFDCDIGGLDVDAENVEQFLFDFGRSVVFNPCTNNRLCYGDFNCDGNVDADDIPKLLEDFGRTVWNNPCPAAPACVVEDWCVYP